MRRALVGVFHAEPLIGGRDGQPLSDPDLPGLRGFGALRDGDVRPPRGKRRLRIPAVPEPAAARERRQPEEARAVRGPGASGGQERAPEPASGSR